MLPIVMSFLDRDWKEKAAAACRYEFANGYRFSFFAIRSYTKLMVVKEDCFLFFVEVVLRCKWSNIFV